MQTPCNVCVCVCVHAILPPKCLWMQVDLQEFKDFFSKFVEAGPPFVLYLNQRFPSCFQGGVMRPWSKKGLNGGVMPQALVSLPGMSLSRPICQLPSTVAICGASSGGLLAQAVRSDEIFWCS